MAEAQNVNIPDTDFKAYLVGETSINTNSDSEIQVSEASAFNGTITAYSKGIRDLTGIEAFTSLTVLNCNANKLNSLDVTKNIALTELYCGRNSLDSIDLSKNTALKRLQIDANDLKKLDISKNTALEWLYCYRNNLTTLDLSKNTVLDYVYCSENDLTSINLSQSINLETLNCSNNELQSIDVSKCTAMKSLTVFANQLTSLDLSKNLSLVSLGCAYNKLKALDITKNTALTGLGCFHNELSSIDLSKNTLLAGLSCYQNELTQLDLTQNIKLIQLLCNDNQLTRLNVANGNNSSFLNNKFNTTNNPNLTCIQVDDSMYSNTNWVNKDTQSYFSESCECIVNIPDANFKAYLTGPGGVDANNDGEIQCSEASSFTGSILCSGKNISSLTGIEAFTEISALNCATNSITNLVLGEKPKLQELYAKSNQISNISISQNSKLHTANLHFNMLTDVDGFLANCSGIKSLTINNNELKTLNLSTNKLLEYLICTNNNITSLDFKNHNSLITVKVSGNDFISLDLSGNPNVTQVEANYCANLNYLNIANGNNKNFKTVTLPMQGTFTLFSATNNPKLTCVQVDDTTYSNSNWGQGHIDAQAKYSINCGGSSSIYEIAAKVNIYPNPTNSSLNIETDKRIKSLKVYSLQGKLLLEQVGNTTTIDVAELPVGIYTLQVEYNNSIGYAKFIKN